MQQNQTPPPPSTDTTCHDTELFETDFSSSCVPVTCTLCVQVTQENRLCIHITKAFKCLVLLQESSKGFSATAQGSLDHLVIFFYVARA